ncbi:MAG: response regulator [Planctomycetes bacterium]|nr:response regulator [Planctomycetota bacterium]
MRILIVDDSKAMRMIVKRTLRQAGFTDIDIVEGATGKEALDMILADAPDLVLSDWNMPEMNGIECLEELNKQGVKVRFGFVTSEGTPEMLQRAQAAGALFVITKPFTADNFKEKLSDILVAS